MCGVSVITMSVSVVSLVAREHAAEHGHAGEPGRPLTTVALLVADEAGQDVGLAVAQPDHVVTVRLLKVGRFWKSAPTEEISSFSPA